MEIIGIICEYNPFHLGHEKQIRHLRQKFPDCAVVCLMSGSFVQRGHPAIFDKSLRAQAAVSAGADLVLELPVPYALSSAEGFAAGGVGILGHFCDYLSFGSECGDEQTLLSAARVLLSDDFPQQLRRELDKGLSFPAARHAALGTLGAVLEKPNDILAVEYCKAILGQGCRMKPLVHRRPGDYHGTDADESAPSATAVRKRMLSGDPWEALTPSPELYAGAPMHCIAWGEKAMLYRLRTMTDEDFAALPYGSEGLWRKFMHACREKATLEQILEATKSKRYTRTRLDRMAMCAFLGISREILTQTPPYVRVLAFTDQGRQVLKIARQTLWLPNAGERIDHPYQALERRWDDLYALFAEHPDGPGGADNRRVYYCAD